MRNALPPRGIPESFWKKLRDAPGAALFLDYDGTLAPFQAKRDAAYPWPGVRESLEHVLNTNTRLVIISGRAVDDLPPLLGLPKPVEIWGCHGAERLTLAGQIEAEPLPPEALRAFCMALRIAAALLPEESLERKRFSVAAHRRSDTEAWQDAESPLAGAWRAIALDRGLLLRFFDGGMELRVPGLDKKFAMTTLLAETPESSAIAYCGDDFTDEDAFRALGRRGLSVLVHPAGRLSAARCRIVPPKELLKFLNTWSDIREKKE